MGLRLRPLHALAPAGALAALVAASLVSAAPAPAAASGTAGRPSAGGATTTTAPGGPAAASTGTTSASTTTTTTPSTASGSIRIEDGGSVTVAVPYLPHELNPATPAGANPVTAMIMAQVWPSAFVVGPGDRKALQTSFVDSAENVSVSPQKVVYTIDPKATWSNGDPIDAADFVATWKEQLALGSELPATDPLAGYEDIQSVTGSKNGKSVTVVFKQPDADWEALFSELAPSKVAARYGWASGFTLSQVSHLVSGGPFAITKVVPGKELVLDRNPAYWGPAAHLNQIVFKVVKGAPAVVKGLEDGSLDVAELTPGPAVRNLQTINRGIGGQTDLSPKLWQVEFNLADPVIGKLVVRKAIAIAISRVELEADSIGLLKPNVSISGNHLYLSGAGRSQGHGGAYSVADVPLAVQLLGEAGYHLGPDGRLVDAAGKVLTVRLVQPTGSPLAALMAGQLRAQLLDAGIVVHVVRTSLSDLLSRVLPGGHYQLALAPSYVGPFPSENATLYTDPAGPVPPAGTDPFSLPAPPPPPGSTTTSTTTTTIPANPPAPGPVQLAYAAGTGSGTEPGASRLGAVTRDVNGYDDPAVDAIFTKAFSDLNPLTMSGLYNQADQQIWADLPNLPLYQVPVTVLHERHLLNLSDSPTFMGPLWNAEDWAIRVVPPPPSTTTTTSSTTTTTTAPATTAGATAKRATSKGATTAGHRG